MRHGLLRGQLAQFVEQHVQLELGVQVAQATIAEGFPAIADSILIHFDIF